MKITPRAPVALLAVLSLSACVTVPDLRGTFAPRPGMGTGTGGAQPGQPAVPSAREAETACLAAARDAGFAVQGVVGTEERGPGRDVIMRINSGGRALDLRCVYAYDTQSARIMTLRQPARRARFPRTPRPHLRVSNILGVNWPRAQRGAKRGQSPLARPSVRKTCRIGAGSGNRTRAFSLGS